MNRRRVVSGLLGALVALALVGVTQAEAQSAAQFLGKWTITFAPPAGAPGGGAGGPPAGAGPGGGGGGFRGAPTVIEVTQNGGTLAATMTGGFGGFRGGAGGPGGAGGAGGAPPAPEPRAITDVKIVNGSLVLSYTQTMGQSGQSVPITLKFTPDGAGMKVEQDRGNGMVRTGTAVKG